MFGFGKKKKQEIRIGEQVWMAENLNVDHYRNGDPIPEVCDPEEWLAFKTGAWCYYDNDPDNGTVYGKLYNWRAIKDWRGLAPQGWHIPSIDEWEALLQSLGGSAAAGGKMKERGTAHWNGPNTGATNESGFTALPGGLRDGIYSNYYYMGDTSTFWSSPPKGSNLHYYWFLSSDGSAVILDTTFVRSGFSVRCVRD